MPSRGKDALFSVAKETLWQMITGVPASDFRN